MHLDKLRRTLAVALTAACFIAVPSHAAKRRSVRHPAAASLSIGGVVTDSVTGAPVVNAKVSYDSRHDDTTDASGVYEIKNLPLFTTPINITVERSGYTKKTVQAAPGTRTLNITVVPTPTVRVRKTDNTVLELDQESILFGYPVPFSGYREDESEDFCRPDGQQIVVHRSEIRKITGPSAPATHAPCCGSVETLKVNVEFKTGQVTDLYFVDACNGFPNIDLKGRNHVTGATTFVPFSQIAEVTFP